MAVLGNVTVGGASVKVTVIVGDGVAAGGAPLRFRAKATAAPTRASARTTVLTGIRSR